MVREICYFKYLKILTVCVSTQDKTILWGVLQVHLKGNKKEKSRESETDKSNKAY